jgi:kinesin family protein 15
LQIAEEHKAYAEGKDEEVKVLEKSIEVLENTVCTLESEVSCAASFIEVLINHSILFVIILNVYSFSTLILAISPKVDIVKEEAERQRMQVLAVPPSGKARRYMEDGMVDLADSSRFVWLSVLLQATYIYSCKRNSCHST